MQTKHRGAQSVTSRPPDQEPKLLDQVSKVLRTKHYSIRTEKAYNDWIYRFIIADREISMTQVVRIWIPYDEIELQRRVEAVRGKWNPQQQLWELPYREVLELELTEFIME